MKLTVLASGSSGNGYYLEGRTSALLIECGVKPERLFRETTAMPSKIAGCLVSHEHGDHAAFAGAYAKLGIPICASAGTLAACKLPRNAKVVPLEAMKSRMIGDFIVRPFDVVHDAAEPLGFIIQHPECGRILFVTDTRIVKYNLRDMRLDHIMVEANYDDRILDRKIGDGEILPLQASRVRGTHMSIDAACDLIRANETGNLKTVILLHLSSQNADAGEMARIAAESALFADIHIARPGLTVELNKNEF